MALQDFKKWNKKSNAFLSFPLYSFFSIWIDKKKWKDQFVTTTSFSSSSKGNKYHYRKNEWAS